MLNWMRLLGGVMRYWKYRLIHNSMLVFTNTSVRNVNYKKAGLILCVIHLQIFTAPPVVPSLQWDDFVLLTCHI